MELIEILVTKSRNAPLPSKNSVNMAFMSFATKAQENIFDFFVIHPKNIPLPDDQIIENGISTLQENGHQEIVDQFYANINNMFRNIPIDRLSLILESVFFILPQDMQNDIGRYILDHFTHQFEVINQSTQISKQLQKDKETAFADMNFLPTLLQSIYRRLSERAIRNSLKNIAVSVDTSEKINFSPQTKIKLLKSMYGMSGIDNKTLMKRMRKIFSHYSLSFCTRKDLFEYFYQKQSRYFDNEKYFSNIFKEILDFDDNIFATNIIMEDPHNKGVLNKRNLLLQKLLNDEEQDRSHLSMEEKEKMLNEMMNVLNHLSPEVEIMMGNHISNAKNRLEIMRRALSASPDSAEGSQWYRTAPKEIVIPDTSSEELVTQGRVLQLAYDTMERHASNPEVYENILKALIQILGSDTAMDGCPSGAIGELIDATQFAYKDDSTLVSEKFDHNTNGADLREELRVLKTILVSLLDRHLQSGKPFKDDLTESENTMLQDPLLSSFFAILENLDWCNITQGLQGKSLVQLFSEENLLEAENDIREDLEALFITPISRVFIYANYKPYLKNKTLDINTYLDPDLTPMTH